MNGTAFGSPALSYDKPSRLLTGLSQLCGLAQNKPPVFVNSAYAAFAEPRFPVRFSTLTSATVTTEVITSSGSI